MIEVTFRANTDTSVTWPRAQSVKMVPAAAGMVTISGMNAATRLPNTRISARNRTGNAIFSPACRSSSTVLLVSWRIGMVPAARTVSPSIWPVYDGLSASQRLPASFTLPSISATTIADLPSDPRSCGARPVDQ